MKALSIVAPNGSKVAEGLKTIEVRSWVPDIELGTDLLIVENDNFLTSERDIDPNGKAVAIVKVKKVRKFIKGDILSACASSWEEGYFSWSFMILEKLKSHLMQMQKEGYTR